MILANTKEFDREHWCQATVIRYSQKLHYCRPDPKAMCEVSDQRQLDFAATEKRCLVTRNRDDFIRLTVQFFNDRRPRCGMLIVQYSLPGVQFSRRASLIKKFSSVHQKVMALYSIAFLPIK
jgi:hypothetical protein